MAKGSVTFGTGSQVKIKSDGRIGVVSSVFPIKTGSRGRPKTNVVVDLNGTIEEYGIKDLKLV